MYIYIYFEQELFLEVLRVIFERREVKVEVLFQRKFRTGFPLKLSPKLQKYIKVRDIFKFSFLISGKINIALQFFCNLRMTLFQIHLHYFQYLIYAMNFNASIIFVLH